MRTRGCRFMLLGSAGRPQGSWRPRCCPLPVGVTDATPRVPLCQAEVFEEIATLEFQFEGIPTVPPRKDMEHFAFFCDGCRYRYVLWNAKRAPQLLDTPLPCLWLQYSPCSVKGSIDETAAAIKQRLWEGGCGRGADMSTGARKVINRCPAHPALACTDK